MRNSHYHLQCFSTPHLRQRSHKATTSTTTSTYHPATSFLLYNTLLFIFNLSHLAEYRIQYLLYYSSHSPLLGKSPYSQHTTYFSCFTFPSHMRLSSHPHSYHSTIPCIYSPLATRNPYHVFPSHTTNTHKHHTRPCHPPIVHRMTAKKHHHLHPVPHQRKPDVLHEMEKEMEGKGGLEGGGEERSINTDNNLACVAFLKREKIREEKNQEMRKGD